MTPVLRYVYTSAMVCDVFLVGDGMTADINAESGFGPVINQTALVAFSRTEFVRGVFVVNGTRA